MSTIISKIRCNNPNKVSSAMRNHNLLLYIGTREGVDISDPLLDQKIMDTYYSDGEWNFPDEKDFADSRAAPNTGRNGLFGNINVSDINSLANHVAQLTREGKNIYNGIISLTEEDAARLGYMDKAAWIYSMFSVIPDVAANFKIPVERLSWTAALHMESGHPHCHYMFWDEGNRVRSSYIHPSVQDKCRMTISKEFLSEDIANAVSSKTLARDMTIQVSKEELNELSSYMNPRQSLPDRFLSDDQKKITDLMRKLIDSLPPKGRISYKLLPEDVKNQVDHIVSELSQRHDIKKELDQYYKSVDDLSSGYSASESKRDLNRNRAQSDIEKRMGNLVLATAKTILQEEKNMEYEKAATASACYSLVRNASNLISDLTRSNRIASDPYKDFQPKKPAKKSKDSRQK